MVVFYVYLFFNVFVFVVYYIILFDIVIINVENVYYFYMGIFIVFRFGFYVFIWMISLYGNVYFMMELVVNNVVVNWIFLGIYNNIDGSVIGIVVVYVNQGDDVLIRMGQIYYSGFIISNNDGKLLFVGWILV